MSYERSVAKFLREECEKTVGSVYPEVGDRATCPTEEHYVTFACGLKPEGVVGDHYATVAQARDEFLAAFYGYALGRKGMLFWRRPPEVCHEDCGGKPGYFIYARLVISEVKETSHA